MLSATPYDGSGERSSSTPTSSTIPSVISTPCTTNAATNAPTPINMRIECTPGTALGNSSKLNANSSTIRGRSITMKSVDDGSPAGPRSAPSCASNSSKRAAATRTSRRALPQARSGSSSPRSTAMRLPFSATRARNSGLNPSEDMRNPSTTTWARSSGVIDSISAAVQIRSAIHGSYSAQATRRVRSKERSHPHPAVDLVERLSNGLPLTTDVYGCGNASDGNGTPAVTATGLSGLDVAAGWYPASPGCPCACCNATTLQSMRFVLVGISRPAQIVQSGRRSYRWPRWVLRPWR